MERSELYLAAVGQLAGGLAHELNNILAVILSSTELAREANGDNATVASELAEIAEAALRAAQLTRQLLAFGGKELRSPRPVALDEIVAGLLPMIRQITGTSIVIAIAHEPGTSTGHPAMIDADPKQLEQIVRNLVANACDAMPGGGVVTIETANAADGVTLSVSDTGCGMTDAVRARIFEPFFTTKNVVRGSGLGLSSVLGIVHQSGGTIEVSSESGRGSTFRVYFPRIETRNRSTSAPRPPGASNSALPAIVSPGSGNAAVVIV